MSKETFYGILFSVGAAAGVILSAVAGLDKTVSIILGLLLGVVVVVIAAKQQARKNKAAAEKQKRIEEEARQQLIRELENGKWVFPVETLHAKFTAKFGEIFTSELKESTYQRAKIIAEEILEECRIPQQYFEQYTNRNTIERYFSEMWERKQEEKQKANEQKLSQLRVSEATLEEECVRYADYIGKDKSIRYCEYQISECKSILFLCAQQTNNVKQGAETTYAYGKQKESSWAVHGGIASGIAGGAAGVATAIEVERKNAEIRQQNAQLAQSVAHMTIAQMDRIWEKENAAEESLKKWEEKLEKAKVLLTQSLDENELLAQLNPSIKSITVSETGAINLKVTVLPAQNLFIYDDIAATIDGSIKAIIKADGQPVGTAICTLPFSGVSYKSVVDGICLQPTKRSETYQVEFVPNHLWAAEKM